MTGVAWDLGWGRPKPCLSFWDRREADAAEIIKRRPISRPVRPSEKHLRAGRNIGRKRIGYERILLNKMNQKTSPLRIPFDSTKAGTALRFKVDQGIMFVPFALIVSNDCR